jgi:hypothetical protein
MKRKLQILTFASITTASFAAMCFAEDAPVSPIAALTPLTAAQRAARPRQAPLQTAAATPSVTPQVDDKAAATTDGPKFVSAAKWILAGYNNDELVYTVVVTSQDNRIIRCTTEVNGFYFEDGRKLTITDRQITTVFPNQATQTGYWMDLDKDSGAAYAVKCNPV